MSKVSSKLQVTVPKAIAERYGIRPGDDIRFEEMGKNIRVVIAGTVISDQRLGTEERLRLFDEATARQRSRETSKPASRADTRGWTREELYTRGRPDVD